MKPGAERFHDEQNTEFAIIVQPVPSRRATYWQARCHTRDCTHTSKLCAKKKDAIQAASEHCNWHRINREGKAVDPNRRKPKFRNPTPAAPEVDEHEQNNAKRLGRAEALYNHTVPDLTKIAAKHEVAGRSKMNKAELIGAILDCEAKQ